MSRRVWWSETLTAHLAALHTTNGRTYLGQLAGHDKKFVDDLMETTQLQRHARTHAKRRLSDEECHARAKMLIEAYAQSL